VFPSTLLGMLRDLVENPESEALVRSRIPSIASFQHGVLESRLTWTFPEGILASLDADHPCRHDDHL
jgi:hypothetical protein